MIHQSALHFIHSEDRQLFISQLHTTDKRRKFFVSVDSGHTIVCKFLILVSLTQQHYISELFLLKN